jgi:hypothetical protein
MLDQLRTQLEPYVSKFAWVGSIVVWLIIIGAVITAAGIAYRWWAAREKAKLDDALDRVA